MMDENAAATLALDAAQVLKGISSDVAEVKEISLEQLRLVQEWTLAHPAEVERPAEEEAQALALDGSEDSPEWVTTLQTSVDVPPEFFADSLSFAWMQTALLAFVLVALLLNLGATLWLSFNRHWRS